MMNREQVKQEAIAMAGEVGLINLSRKALCDRAGIPDGSFPHVMGCNFTDFIEELKDALLPGRTGPVTKSRANPALRKNQILNVAVELAKEQGYHKITRDGVAEAAGVSMGLVTRYFGTMLQLRNKVVCYAIKNELLEIVAQCIVNDHPKAKKVSPELRAKAMSAYSK